MGKSSDGSRRPASVQNSTRNCSRPVSGSRLNCSTRWWKSDGPFAPESKAAMTAFVFAVLAVWISAMGAWWFFSRAFRRADAGRLKERLSAGAGAKREKKSKKSQLPALFQQESGTGLLAASLMKRLRLSSRIGELLEQAGLRWHPTRFIHASLGLFLAVFAVCWFTIPEDYRQLSFLPAILGGLLPLGF